MRHGETAWNKAKIFRGRTDIPLNEQGRREAECCAAALRQTPLLRLYVSPLKRAMETAGAIARGRDLDVASDEAFNDIDYGDWSGKADAEVREAMPDAYRMWKESPHKVKFPGGESLDDVRARAAARLRELAKLHEGDAFGIVSHRVVLKLLMAEAKGLDNSRFWDIPLDTAAISVLDFSQGRIRIVRENDTQHLKALSEHSSVDF